VDILGFSDIIASIPQKPERFQQILSILTALKERTETTKHDDGKVILHNRKATSFSDSIVISYPVLEWGAGRALCRDLVWLARALLMQGILIRGAVTIGSLYHSDGIVFGDALIEAHILETRVAIYPRIVLQDAVLESNAWLKDAPAFCSGIPAEEPESSQRDADGVWFLNPLQFGSWSVDFAGVSPSTFLNTVRQRILEKYDDANKRKRPEILVKLTWLAKQFNESLENARKYQGAVRAGKIRANYPLPHKDEDFATIQEIQWQEWMVLPLSQNSDATRYLFDPPGTAAT
jgi:hypothetical protein